MRDKQITIEKVLGTENCADLGTKILGITELTKPRYDCGVRLLNRSEEDDVTATLCAVKSVGVPKISKASYGVPNSPKELRQMLTVCLSALLLLDK